MSDDPKTKRSIRSIKKTYPKYWNLVGVAFILFAAFAIAISFTFYWVLDYQQEMMSLMDQDQLTPEMKATQHNIINLFWAQIALFLLGSIGLFIRTGHRIAGTYLALQRTFSKVEKGDLTARIQFRDYDNLNDLADSFNTMMDSVEEQHRSTSPENPPEEKKKAPDGFTIVELMIVVSIIALLITLAIPTISKPRDVARRDVCKQNLRLINDAKELWAIDEGMVPGDVPDITDIEDFVKSGASSLSCPIDPSDSFAASYEINGVGTHTTCKILPATHHLD